jgi:hypothetical protein
LTEEDKSPRRTTAVLNITTETTQPDQEAETAAPKKTTLKRYVLEKLRTWVNSLLGAECGLNLEAVELGIMDGLPGLEQIFRGSFPELRRNAAKSTPKPMPAGECGRRSGSCSPRP